MNNRLLTNLIISLSLLFNSCSNKAIFDLPKPLSYNGSLMKQVPWQKDKLLSFINEESFLHDNKGVIEDLGWPLVSTININRSSMMTRLSNGYFAMVCGNTHITIFDETQNIIKEYRESTSFDTTTSCSFIEIDSETYLFAYIEGYNYQIRKMSYDTLTNTLTASSYKLALSKIPLGTMCDYFKASQHMICIYGNALTNLEGRLIDDSMTIISPVISIAKRAKISDYKMIAINDNEIIVFYAFTYLLYGKVLSFDTDLNQGPETDVLIQNNSFNYCPLSLLKLENILLLVVVSKSYIIIVKSSYDLKHIKTVLAEKPFNYQYLETVYYSFGIINDYYSLLLSTNLSKNYKMGISFPICNNKKEYNMITNMAQNLIELGELGAINQYIMFTKKNIAAPPESSPISLHTSLLLEYLTIEFTSGGVFVYTFNIIQSSNGVSLPSLYDCEVTFNVCFDLCDTCSVFGNVADHNCLSCKKGFILDPKKPFNCMCDTYYYIDNLTDEYVCLPDNICPISHPVLINGTKQCAKCLEDHESNSILPLGFNKITHKCVTNRQFIDDINDRILNKLDDNILDLLEYYYIWKQNDFEFAVYENTPEGQLQVSLFNISLIDLGSCESKLKKENNIPNNQPLLIAKIEYAKDKDVLYTVYSIIGVKLNTLICNDVSIIIEAPIPPDSGIDVDKAKEMLLKGINVLNAAEPFFNDICYPFLNEDGLDITINDRRNDLFQNITLCEPNCFIYDINYDTNIVRCKCKLNPKKEEKVQNTFLDAIPVSNIIIVKCYHQFFQLNNLTYNIAFWVLSGVICLFVGCFGWFSKAGINNIYSKLNKYPDNYKHQQNVRNADAKQRDYNQHDYNGQSYSSHRSQIHNVKSKDSSSRLSLYNNLSSQHTNRRIITPLSSVSQTKSRKSYQCNPSTRHTKYSTIIHVHELKTSNSNISSRPRIHSKDDVSHLKAINEKNKNNTNKDIDYLCPYTYAERCDRRNVFLIFWNIFKQNYVFIRPFTSQSLFDLVSVKFAALLLNLSLQLTINALFYSDDIVSEKYNSGGDLLTISSLLKSIYSCLLNAVVISFLLSLTKYQQLLEFTLKEYQLPEAYLRIVKTSINKTRKKILAFFILGIFALGCCWYYCGIFCIIYKGSQVGLFIDGLNSIGIASLTTFSGILLVSIMRYWSIKVKSKNMYYTSNYLLRFFG